MNVQRLSIGSIFKLIGIGSTFSLVPFCIVLGFFALFGAHTVEVGDEYITGAPGLLVSPFVGLILAGMFTAIFGSLCAFGFWLFSMFWPIKLSVKKINHDGVLLAKGQKPTP